MAIFCATNTGIAGSNSHPMDMDNPMWIQSVKSITGQEHSVILSAVFNTGEPVQIQISPLKGNMVRVRVCQQGNFEPTLQEKDGFIKSDWPEIVYEMTESDHEVQIQMDSLEVKIRKDPFHLSFLQDDSILTCLTEEKSILFDGESCEVRLSTPVYEKFMGFGYQGSRYVYPFDPGRTPFDHRGHHVQMMGLTNQRAYYVPFFQSSRGYGFFLNTLTESFWDMAKTNSTQYSITIDEPVLDFYLIAGPEFKTILKGWSEIVGRATLPPKWRLGRKEGEPVMFGIIEDGRIPYHGWNTQWYDTKQIIHRMHQMRDEDIPGDYYLLENTWQTIRNSFEWVSEIPDPKFLLDTMRAMHFKPCLWERPTLHADDYALYNTAGKKGYLVRGPDGDVFKLLHNFNERRLGQVKAMVDFTNPAAVKWWSRELDELIKLGGWMFKMDSEGSGFNENVPETKKTRWHNGMTGRQLENYYGPMHMKVVYEATRKALDGKRACMGCYHQGYFASPKYPYMAFGDRNTYSNNELRIRPAINNAMCGIAYWEGGGGISFDGIPGLGDVERIRLIPHTYTCWHIATSEGIPIMRPMVLEFQDDPECYRADAQYMFGKEFLVAPGVRGAGISREVYPDDGRQRDMWVEGRHWRKVYLPAGEWVNHWTKEKYLGPAWKYFPVRENQAPLFVREGSIIPRGPFVEFLEQKPMDPIELEVYPCGKSEFTMYEDDGESYAYESGEFVLTRFTCEETTGGIEFRIHPVQGEFPGMFHRRDYVLKVIGTTEPGAIFVDGQEINTWDYHGSRKHDDLVRCLTFDVKGVNAREGASISIKGAETIKIYF